MSTTRITDFKIWLKGIDNDDAVEMEQLYYAVRNVDEDGLPYSCENIGGDRYLVKSSYTSDELLLLSDKTVKYFLDYLESTYGDGDIEANASFQRATREDD